MLLASQARRASALLLRLFVLASSRVGAASLRAQPRRPPEMAAELGARNGRQRPLHEANERAPHRRQTSGGPLARSGALAEGRGRGRRRVRLGGARWAWLLIGARLAEPEPIGARQHLYKVLTLVGGGGGEAAVKQLQVYATLNLALIGSAKLQQNEFGR